MIEENNLIFEGWNDKRLFAVALENAETGLKRRYRDVGVYHARGVKTVKAITPMLELAKRRCLIVSDSDTPGKEQKKLYENDKGFGEWKTYQDVDPTIEAITGEDFVKNDFVAKQTKAVLSDTTMPIFDEALLPEKKGKVAAIAKWLSDNGMTKEQATGATTRIKDAIFENLKRSNVDEIEYAKLLAGISSILWPKTGRK